MTTEYQNSIWEDHCDRHMQWLADYVKDHGIHAIFTDPITNERTTVDLLPNLIPPMAVAGTIAIVVENMGVCKPEMCHRQGTAHAIVEAGKYSYAVCCPILLGDLLGVKQRKLKKSPYYN